MNEDLLQHAIIEQMRNLGYEPIYVAGFSDDFLMWTEISTGKEFGIDCWDGVKQFIADAAQKQPQLATALEPKPQPRETQKQEQMALASLIDVINTDSISDNNVAKGSQPCGLDAKALDEFSRD